MVPDGAPFLGPAEAAWFEVYQRDLVDDLWGPDRFSRRRITAMLEGLPHDSALWRALEQTAPFTNGYIEHLIGLVLQSSEHLRVMNYSKKDASKFKAITPVVPWKQPTKRKDVDDMSALSVFQGIAKQLR